MSATALVAVGVALAVPRLARMLYPQVWIEDEAYLHNAFLLAQGQLPYRDFPMPHLPLLEGLLAALFRVAPVSIRTAEAFTQVAALGGSLLVFLVGRRLGGLLAGVAGALIFANSALLFRYHVFEREVFVVVPVLAAVHLCLRDEPGTAMRSDSRRETRAAAAAGVLMFTALAIKLTAIAASIALVLQLIAEQRRRSAALVAMTTLALLGLAIVGLTAAFRTDFLVQVFLFRAAHATFPSLRVKLDELRYTMDISLAFGAAGVVLIAWTGTVRRWLGPLLQIASGVVLLVFLNPTYWPHTGIELLPWLSLMAGGLVAEAVRLGPAHSSRRAMARAASHRRVALLCASGGIAMVLFVSPIRNLNWEAGDGSVYGFGYRDRAELESIGHYVMTNSAPDATVAAPPTIAFVANRREAIPYAEIAGTIEALTEAVRRDGYWGAFRSKAASSGPLWEEVESSRERMAPMMRRLLESHQVAVLVNDSSDDLMAVPLVDISDEELQRYGYGSHFATAHYRAWVPSRLARLPHPLQIAQRRRIARR